MRNPYADVTSPRPPESKLDYVMGVLGGLAENLERCTHVLEQFNIRTLGHLNKPEPVNTRLLEEVRPEPHGRIPEILELLERCQATANQLDAAVSRANEI